MRKEIEQNDPNEEVFGSKTNTQIESDRLAVDREIRQLDLELKREQVRDLRAAKQALLDKARMQKAAIDQFVAQRKLRQNFCNHLKGGIGAEAVLKGQGQSAMACVIKHKLPAGNYMVLCQRCGKEWFGPLTALQNGGVAKPPTKGFYKAIQLPTNNSESGSSRFDFAVAQPVGEAFDGEEE